MWMAGFCSYDTISLTVKYSFYTEGILERKRSKVNECWGCCVNDNYTWKFYPRHEIDHIQVDNLNVARCCGICNCSCLECASHNTIVDIVTRMEVATGVNDPGASTDGGCAGGVKGCFSGASHAVALKMENDEAEAFYLYCQNYTYNTNYQPTRIYNMEFLKTIGENKYAITPTDWVNYFLSSNGPGFREGQRPAPQGTVNFSRALGGGALGGGGGGIGGGLVNTCCCCCK